jgi:MoxR-like ATPase
VTRSVFRRGECDLFHLSQYVTIEGITLKLQAPLPVQAQWEGRAALVMMLQAAWLKLSPQESPMNPRLLGRPGVGKTTLAHTVAHSMGLPVFAMQGTSDLRPDDLLVTPVLDQNKQIKYVASALVSAMILGGVCILDEGNRMPEKSWASLVPLLDDRRYVESMVAGIRIPAHPEFRFVTTMNDDASVFDLPEYIQSRLCPQILVDFPEPAEAMAILKRAVPKAHESQLERIVQLLLNSQDEEVGWGLREGIQIAKYMARLQLQNPELGLDEALYQATLAVLGGEGVRALENAGPWDASLP